MTRRRLKIGIAATLALAGAAAAAYVGRAALLDVALREVFARAGYPHASFEVAAADPGGLELVNLSLGPGAPSAGRVAVRFHFWDEAAPAIVEIDGLRYPVTPGGGGDPCEEIDSVVNPPGLGLVSWPRIVLKDAVVTVPGSRGDIQFSADGTLDLAVPALALSGAIGAGHTDAAYRIESAAGGAELQATLAGESDVADLPWPSGSRAPDSGHAVFKLDATVTAPRRGKPACEAALAGAIAARLDLSLDSVSIPGRATGLAVDAALDATAAGGEMQLSLARPLRVTAAALSLPAVAGLPSALADRIAHGGTLTLSAADAGAPLLRVVKEGHGWFPLANADLKIALAGADAALRVSGAAHLDEDMRLRTLDRIAIEAEAHGIPAGAGEISSLAWKADAQGADGKYVATGPLDLRLEKLAAFPKLALAFAGPVTITAAAPTVTLEAAKPAAISVTGETRFAAVGLDGPLKLAVASARVVRDENATVLDAVLDPGKLSGRVFRERADPVAFQAAPGPVSVHASLGQAFDAELGVKRGGIVFPAYHIAADSIAAAIPFTTGAAARAGRVSGTLRSGADPALFEPVAVTAKIAEKKNVYEAAGKLTLTRHKVGAPLTARYDLGSGRGEARLGPADLAFAGDSLQPADLSPLLAKLQKAQGSVGIEGTLAYDRATGVSGTGKIGFESLSFAAGGADVEGLNGTVQFVDLLDPRTAPRQNLTAKRVVAGAALDDVAVRFQLSPEDRAPVLALDEAVGNLAGGTIAVRRASIRIGAANDMTVEVSALSLSKLFQTLGTDSLQGTGTLTGAIPIRIGGGEFSVADGRLKAEAPGVLQVHLGSARETLEKQGEAMSLMVHAMEDFHYKSLEIGVTRKPGADIVLAVKLEGNNPAVLEGYPFRFNINLSGDLDRLLAALQAGRGLTADVLEKAVEVDR